MKYSLKGKLFEAIKGGYPNMFSQERVEDLAREAGYKVSNAERRLRELCEEDDAGYAPVRATRNEKGFIMGYVYQEPPKPVVIRIPPKQKPLFDFQGSYRRKNLKKPADPP